MGDMLAAFGFVLALVLILAAMVACGLARVTFGRLRRRPPAKAAASVTKGGGDA
jgi:hypothetical protein